MKRSQQFIIGRKLLYEGIRQIKEVNNSYYIRENIKVTSYNKPYFKNKEVGFNISHSNDIVVCLMSDTLYNIGIDIEFIKNINYEDFEKHMLDEEYKEIKNSSNSNIAFYEYWTKKESVVKASGEGIYIPFNSFRISNNCTSVNNKDFLIRKIELSENYICHLAYKIKKSIDLSKEEKIIIRKVDF
ncbi:4'-phosphopantetheinyl transferase family protein [Tenacibaculum sp. C7A-26P2]|uniref:4'-phosphopantetheinyl transferase family protein n=1 Tax=Tenacibaculum sp. C7A-26P2 TaxID=3447504 RepID=UPI003F87077C